MISEDWFPQMGLDALGKLIAYSGVARGGKLGHALWGAGLKGATPHFLQSF